MTLIKVVRSKYVKGRFDILDEKGIVVNFRFSKSSAKKFAEKWRLKFDEKKIDKQFTEKQK